MDLSPVIKTLIENCFLVTATSISSLDEALNSLNYSKLRDLCKKFRVVATTQDKLGCIDALRLASRKQRTLGPQTTLDRMLCAAIQCMGSCIRLQPHVRALFMRVEIIFFMKTSMREYSLATVVLAENKSWTYPSYVVAHQSHALFQSRRQLIDYAEALEQERCIEQEAISKSSQTIGSVLQGVYERWCELVLTEQCEDPSPILSDVLPLTPLKQIIEDVPPAKYGRCEHDCSLQAIDITPKLKYTDDEIKTATLQSPIQIFNTKSMSPESPITLLGEDVPQLRVDDDNSNNSENNLQSEEAAQYSLTQNIRPYHGPRSELLCSIQLQQKDENVPPLSDLIVIEDTHTSIHSGFSFSLRYTAVWVYTRLVSLYVEWLERTHNYSTAGTFQALFFK